jgi:hypothetical protein
MKYITQYLINLLLILDEFGNTLTLGSPDETISSRSAKARNKGKVWGCVMCKFLNIFQKDHCDKALIIDRGEDAILKD